MAFSLADVLGIPLPRLHVVDVGASLVEGADHYAPLVDAGLCTVTGFEPDPEQFVALEDSGREGYRYLPYALGDGSTHTFHVANFPGCSSIFPPNPRYLDRFTAIGASLPDGNFATVGRVPVRTLRLDDLQELEAPDYLKLDIQGAERDVLANGVRTLRDTLVIESEVLFGRLYEGQGDFADLTVTLREQGFDLVEMRDVRRCAVAPFLHADQAFSSRGVWMWADAVFVRRWDDLTGWSDDALTKAATLLHVIYGMVDLAHHFLLEMQIRTDLPLADRYRAAVLADPAFAAEWSVLPSAWPKAIPMSRVLAYELPAAQRPNRVSQSDSTSAGEVATLTES